MLLVTLGASVLRNVQTRKGPLKAGKRGCKRWKSYSGYNIDDKQSKGIHWVLLLIDRNIAVYFDSLGNKHTAQKLFKELSYISRHEFVSVHNVLKECNEMKEEIESCNNEVS